jgi:hypothetical protein
MSEQGPVRKSSEIFVLQVARFGGELKLGLHTDPEGAWIDHDVFLDRAEAEEAARRHENVQALDAVWDGVSSDVVNAARVVSLEEVEVEFGQDRARLLTTMFQSRLRELWSQLHDSESAAPGDEAMR